MYTNFRKWVKMEYPPNGVPTSADWETLKKEDEKVEYEELETETVEDNNDDTGFATDINAYSSEDIDEGDEDY